MRASRAVFGLPAAESIVLNKAMIERGLYNSRAASGVFFAEEFGSQTSAAINAAIEAAESAGGGLVQLLGGSYELSSAIVPKSSVTLQGLGAATRLVQKGSAALAQGSDTALTRFKCRDLTFVYDHATPSQDHTALDLRSHNYCNFADLVFEDYATATAGSPSNDGQIIAKINPDYDGSPAQNAIFNNYENWEVEECRIGVWYEGLDDNSTPDPDPASGSYEVTSSISGNYWRGITFRRVYLSAIHAKQWVDSEKWYGMYAQAAEDDCILINLNTDETNWWQVDRFFFSGPTVTYAPSGVTESTVNAFRLGPGTFRTVVNDLVTDKPWTNFLDDDSAISYYLTGDLGDGYNGGKLGVAQKGIGTFNHGSATIVAGQTQKAVSHGLRRAPTNGEIVIAPREDMGSHRWWISGHGAATFTIDIDSTDGSDLTFTWTGQLGEL
jgi:hypothetical protein